MSHAERRNLLEWGGPMSIAQQCRILGISRRSAYASPRQASAADLELMRRMDELHTEHPFHGSRQIVNHLWLEGVCVGRHRVRRMMRIMGLRAVSPKPRTSVKAAGHQVFPYLLEDLCIDQPDQVWCADITYIPMHDGFLYLVAVMDWATRFVLSWRLSNSMETGFCVAALEDALHRADAPPSIFNTDQGAQFTSAAFVDAVQGCGAKVSMDGKGRWVDNVFIERLWRSLKCEAVHLHELANGIQANQVIGGWMEFHNHVRPHGALGGITPAMAYERKRLNWRRAA